jgi:hypothetical protein
MRARGPGVEGKRGKIETIKRRDDPSFSLAASVTIIIIQRSGFKPDEDNPTEGDYFKKYRRFSL